MTKTKINIFNLNRNIKNTTTKNIRNTVHQFLAKYFISSLSRFIVKNLRHNLFKFRCITNDQKLERIRHYKAEII